MIIILFLFLALIILILVFTIRTTQVVKTQSLDKVINYFNNYLRIIFIGLFILYTSMIIIQAFYVYRSELILISLIKFIIYLFYFYAIYNHTVILLKNLKIGLIFDHYNSKLTKKIGMLFINLAIVEIIAGLLLGLLWLLSHQNFEIMTSSIIILFIIIGFILLIVSFILEKAIEIYHEHNLTI